MSQRSGPFDCKHGGSGRSNPRFCSPVLRLLTAGDDARESELRETALITENAEPFEGTGSTPDWLIFQVDLFV
jgi:hypothetical protein